MIKLDWKMYAVISGVVLLALFVILLEKIFFFLVVAVITVLLALLLRFAHPVKYLGIELVTLSSMFVGVVYGPVIGGLYAFTILLTHLIVGNYHIGAYLMWVIPEYILLGVLSGIFGTGIIGPLGIGFIIGMNLLNIFFTFVGENERFAKELPYAIGNSLINSIILVKFFSSVVSFIS